MSGPRLRPAGPEDDAGIRRLLALAYEDGNPKTDAGVMAWQYRDNPFGATRSWVFEDAGRIVCHWSAIPVPLLLDGRAVTGAKGVDIATDPAYRRRGLFRRVAERLLADLADAGVPVLLSHPNARSVRAVQEAGARSAVRAAIFAAPTRSEWLADRFRLPAAAGRAAGRLFRAPEGGAVPHGGVDVPEGTDELWQRVAAGLPYGVVRDAAWWRWRYAAHPVHGYTLTVLRRGGRLEGLAASTVREAFGGLFLHVLDALAPSRDAARELIGSVRREAPGAVDGVVLAAAPRSALAAMARAGGLRRVPPPLLPGALRTMVAAPGGDSAALARAPWAMSWGDLDHL